MRVGNAVATGVGSKWIDEGSLGVGGVWGLSFCGSKSGFGGLDWG